MELRQLGRTGLMVSTVGMGGIPIQRVESAQAAEVIEKALAEGINFIDTARGYTDSEVKLGEVLGKNRGKVIIATKSMARTKADMAKDIEISLKNLQVDCIDLYQVHNVKDEGALAKVLGPEGALEALKEAQKQGKIKFIGITGHIPAILVQAIKTGEFDTVQFPFNTIETGAAKDLLPLAKELGLGTIAMKPFAGGALKHAEPALRFILEHGFTTVIPGMDSIAQIEENVAAGRRTHELTEEEKTVLREEAELLGETFCRRCEYCQPCPQGIDIPSVFLLEGYWTRYGLKEWARERYQPMGVKASACVECGECETKCPYQLPIRNMLKTAHEHLA